MKAVKIGVAAIVGVVALTLVTLRLTGLDPGYLDSRSPEFAASNRVARPGLWLKEEVGEERVTDWAAVAKELEGKTGAERRIQVETRTWYGIPHSVTVGGDMIGRDGGLYIHGHSDPNRMHIPFPNDKAWTRNVARDPRIRIRVAGKIYNGVAVSVTDRAEGAALLRRDPLTVEIDADGKEHVKEVMHIWRVYQSNVSDYSSGSQGVARNE